MQTLGEQCMFTMACKNTRVDTDSPEWTVIMNQVMHFDQKRMTMYDEIDKLDNDIHLINFEQKKMEDPLIWMGEISTICHRILVKLYTSDATELSITREWFTYFNTLCDLIVYPMHMVKNHLSEAAKVRDTYKYWELIKEPEINTIFPLEHELYDDFHELKSKHKDVLKNDFLGEDFVERFLKSQQDFSQKRTDKYSKIDQLEANIAIYTKIVNWSISQTAYNHI